MIINTRKTEGLYISIHVKN